MAVAVVCATTTYCEYKNPYWHGSSSVLPHVSISVEHVDPNSQGHGMIALHENRLSLV